MAEGTKRYTLIEREGELASIDDALEAARSGHGRLVMIEGEPGIGKTSLLAATRDGADSAGFTVLHAAGDELEAAFPFGLAIQLLEPALAAAGAAERRHLLDGPAGLASVLFEAGEAAKPAETPGDASFARVHGLTWLCTNLSQRAPLLLSVDDAQWADGPSLTWLRYLARRIDGFRVLLAVAAWGGEPERGQRVLRRLGDVADVHLLRPGPLSEAAAGILARARLGDVATEELARACHRAAGGNPFFLRELLGELSALPPDRIPARVAELVPGAVSRAVAGRLARLPASAAALARAAAVLGEPAELRHLAAVAALPEDEATAATDVLVAAGIATAEMPPRFAHPLVRAAIHTETSPAERASLHHRAARVLARHGAAPERISAHLLESEPDGSEWAVTALRASAQRALANGDPSAAVRFLRRALGESPPGRDGVLLELGRAQIEAADFAAIATLQTASESGDVERSEALRELGRALALFGLLDEAAEAFSRAAAAAEDRRDVRLQIEAELASIQLTLTGGAGVAERLAGHRDGLAGESGGERMLMAVIAFADAQGNRPSGPSADLAARALRGWKERGLRAASLCFYEGVIALMYADRYDEALRFLDDAIREARAQGSPTGLANASWLRAWCHLRCGRIAEAQAEASMVKDLEADPGSAAPLLRGMLVETLVERGNLDEAEAELGPEAEGPISTMSLFNPLRYARGLLRMARGRHEDAVGDLLETGRIESEAGGVSPAAFPWRSMAALAYARSGEVERGRELVGEALGMARAFGAPRPIGIALRVDGVLEGGPEGVRSLGEAVTVLERSPARLEHARALLDLGAAQRRSGNRRLARESLLQALDLADRCGALPVVARARQELLAAGARPRRTRLRGRDALTASELRVARMAADGHSNRDIAHALFITVRTVEGHLSRAYAKLDIARREELADALDGPTG